mgnify:CR=1 FL=1
MLPCWRELATPEWRARVAEMVDEIEAEEAQRCVEEHGLALEDRILGVPAVLLWRADREAIARLDGCVRVERS